MKEKLLISACLTGENCKYSGGNNALPEEQLRKLRTHYELVPVSVGENRSSPGTDGM